MTQKEDIQAERLATNKANQKAQDAQDPADRPGTVTIVTRTTNEPVTEASPTVKAAEEKASSKTATKATKK